MVEIWGELFPPQYNLRNMIGLGFVEGEGVVLWSWNFDRRQKGAIRGCYGPWFEENWSRGTLDIWGTVSTIVYFAKFERLGHC